MYARIGTLAAVCAGLLVAVAAVSGTALAGGGNSQAAKQCQQGGWQSPAQRDNGTAFRSQADCIAYASAGGHVYKPSLLAVPGFVTEEENVALIASGFHPNSAGRLAIAPQPSKTPYSLYAVTDATGGLTGSSVFTAGACALGLTGADYSYTDGSGVHASASATLLCL
jgi:hypothetical protein